MRFRALGCGNCDALRTGWRGSRALNRLFDSDFTRAWRYSARKSVVTASMARMPVISPASST